MKKSAVALAQEFLTINHPVRTWRIKLNELLARQSVEEVLEYLERLHSDHRRRLDRLIRLDKADPRVNESVALVFRLKMAIRVLKKEMVRKKAA